VKGGLSGVAHFLGLASGGVSGAASGGPRGGWTMVGEAGPELVRLPYGSHVLPAGQSAAMAGGGGGGVIELRLVVDGSDSEIMRALMRRTRLMGGDPAMFTRKVAYRSS
jgi:hypothetical protein